jgi:hypothetical protein
MSNRSGFEGEDGFFEYEQQRLYTLYSSVVRALQITPLQPDRGDYIVNAGSGRSFDSPALQAFTGTPFSLQPVHPVPVIHIDVLPYDIMAEESPSFIRDESFVNGDAADILPALANSMNRPPSLIVARNANVSWRPIPGSPYSGKGWQEVIRSAYRTLPAGGHMLLTLREIHDIFTAEHMMREAGFQQTFELQRHETSGTLSRFMLLAMGLLPGGIGKVVMPDMYVVAGRKTDRREKKKEIRL